MDMAEEHVMANGNGVIKGVTPVDRAGEPKENIFLFIPNLIGTRWPGLRAVCLHANTIVRRLRSHRPCSSVIVLYANPPSHLLWSL